MSSSFAAERQLMVEQQLRARGIRDERVLAAMNRVPREAFVTEQARSSAYDDCALPIACGQTISQPYIVGLMTAALELTGGERVLEIGTGSGYQAAVLDELGAEVYTIERHPPLAAHAAAVLKQHGYARAHVKSGDGTLGWPEESPFDRVIITAGGREVPRSVWEQLREGGILVAPLGEAEEQELLQIHKRHGKPTPTVLCGCRFVPLIHGQAE
jgi:protein-L-isoaspartate(D-aspartate) O-methyltransferase